MKISIKSIPLFIFALLFVISCRPAAQANFNANEKDRKIEIVSGGQIIRTYISNGGVNKDGQGGYYFMDSMTKKLIVVTGQVIITQFD